MNKIIRYVGKHPDNVADSLIFSKKYDEHYTREAAKHKLTHYFISKSNEHFFMVTRPAPSLHEKWVATGGRITFNEADDIESYEEVFRTWKMVKDTLSVRSTILFDKMVNGESLDPYLTKNSLHVEFIEFPDDNVYYDKTLRKWRSTKFASVEEFISK